VVGDKEARPAREPAEETRPARERRLAEAMRANLRKRKEQQRAKQAAEPERRGDG
jgi:hypothetical protein